MADGPSTSAEGACGGTREYGSEPSGEDPVQSLHDDRKRQEYESGSWHPEMFQWQESVKWDYPEWKTKSYLVPPIHMNTPAPKKQEKKVKIAEASVPVAHCPLQKDTKDDLAQQHALHCFQHLANHEVMFILSQLDFEKYLKRMRRIRSSEESKFVFPRASDPELKKKGLHKGDFDILVIHRLYGFLGCEIKSYGYDCDDYQDDDQETLKDKKQETKTKNPPTLEDIIKNDAVRQLKKYREVLSYILSDLQPACQQQRSLILPYVERKKLTDLLNENIQLKKELCVCLGLPETSDPFPYCLLSDDMSDKHQPWKLTDAVKTSLDAWWRRVMADRGHDPHMTETRYLNIISRFCGPDTQISGPRTMGEAVAHMGEQFMKFSLTQEQLDIVNEDLPYLWVVGPPGVGKTLVLICKALQWLLKGMEVRVISLYDQGLAAAELICSELQQFDPEKRHLVHHHHAPSEGEGSVLKMLETAAKNHKIAVVMDEASEVMSMLSETDQSCPLRSHYESFISRIVRQLDIKRLWAASCHPVGRSVMDDRRLTRSLRAPPTIARETAKSSTLQIEYSEFKLGNTPPVTDGVGWVKVIEHLSGGQHQGAIPADCRYCGKELAKFLREDLRVGNDSPRITSQGNVMKRSPLRFEHIFILSIKPFPMDLDRPAGEGQRESYRHFLLGLRDGGIPVKVVQRQDREAVQSMAIPRLEVKGAVIASDIYSVRSLERPLVVWVQAEEEGSHQQALEVDLARMYGMSRAAAHLVCVCTPGVARAAEWVS